MYAPPALGYALIVWRYEKTRITSRATMPSDSGMSVPNASAPAPPINRTVSISSVAYATEESASLANTASAVLLPRRSWISWSVRIFRPDEHVGDVAPAAATRAVGRRRGRALVPAVRAVIRRRLRCRGTRARGRRRI